MAMSRTAPLLGLEVGAGEIRTDFQGSWPNWYPGVTGRGVTHRGILGDGCAEQIVANGSRLVGMVPQIESVSLVCLLLMTVCVGNGSKLRPVVKGIPIP